MAVHPDSVVFQRAMVRCAAQAIPWSGMAYRAAAMRFANRDDLLTGMGSRQFGGRWNPPGSFRTVYLSVNAETALAEYLGQQMLPGLTAFAKMPMALVGVEVRLERVLDFASASVRKHFGVSIAHLVQDDWFSTGKRRHESLAQSIGRLAFEADFDGLIVPSAVRRAEWNLAVFPGNLVPPRSYLNLANRHELPPLGR